MKLNRILKHAGRGVGLTLKLYLVLFLLGCVPRPMELSVEENRRLSTRSVAESPAKVAKAVVLVLQDMHFTLDVVDTELGVITANKRSERSQGRISEETPAVETEEGLSEAEQFCLVVSIVAVVTLVLSWIFNSNHDDDDDRDDDRGRSHHHRRGTFVHHHIWDESDYRSGASYYEYVATINFSSNANLQTDVRLSIQGSHYDDGVLQAAGPVQEAELYDYFFGQLQKELQQLSLQP